MKTEIISFIYKNILKPILFKFDPEHVHDGMSNFGKLLGNYETGKSVTRWMFYYKNQKLSQKVAGIKFDNPVGLSAGFDKNGNLISILPEVGFGFMEVGTVTFEEYEGNPKPRLYRLPKSRSLVVNYGLKNDGSDVVIERIKNTPKARFPISISIGKTNCARAADSVEGAKDYFNCLKCFSNANIGDFYVLNISCPNTFGGEPFTTKAELSLLLKTISPLKIKKPVFIKMPGDLSWEKFNELLGVAVKFNIQGVIIANLNKDRKNPVLVQDELPANIKGNFSGYPTWKKSNELISKTYQTYGDKLIIIGVGGIFSAYDAYEKIKRGATLVQLITGMIFEGPQLIGNINKGLAELMARDGYKNISEAVGAYHREN